MQTLSRGSLRGRAGRPIILHDFVSDFFCKILYFGSSDTVPSTIEWQKHDLRQTQSSRTKACSQVHTAQVHMTSSSPSQNGTYSGGDIGRRIRAGRSDVNNFRFGGTRVCIKPVSLHRVTEWVLSGQNSSKQSYHCSLYRLRDRACMAYVGFGVG